MKERKCHACTAGRMVCPRCGGAGMPGGKKVLAYFEKTLEKCGQCLGCGTIYCLTCGGIGVRPPRKVLA